MAQPQMIADRLSRIGEQVDQRLGRVDKMLPMQRPTTLLPFEDYLPRAQARAQADPVFKQQFDEAMRQYQAAGQGVQP